MNSNKSLRGTSSARLSAIVAFMLGASSLALAQNAPTLGAGAMPPAREGNIYDYQDHQPTQAEVDRAEAAAGIRPSSQESETQIEKEVEDAIETDKRSVEDFKKHSNRGQ